MTVRACKQIETALGDEFGAWCAALPGYPDCNFPRPTGVGGLPQGWRIRSTARSNVPVWVSDGLPGAEPIPNRSVWHVVSRADGGWALFQHYRDGKPRQGHTSMQEHAATLMGLYERVCGRADAGAFHIEKARTAEEVVRRFIASRYNLNDPSEAAEQMLVALGQRPTFVPARLAREDTRRTGLTS